MESERTPSKSSRSPPLDSTEQQIPSIAAAPSLLFYNYTRDNRKNDPQRERHFVLTCIVLQLFFLSLVLFFSALALNYLIVKS